MRENGSVILPGKEPHRAYIHIKQEPKMRSWTSVRCIVLIRGEREIACPSVLEKEDTI